MTIGFVFLEILLALKSPPGVILLSAMISR